MNNLLPDQQAILAAWQQHTYAEFVLKDADAALATMTENPYVLAIPAGTAAIGRAAVREYYAEHFLPQSRGISKSPLCPRPLAMIAWSRKWLYDLPIRSIWTGCFLACDQPGDERSLS